MKIGELARATGFTAKTIRFYEGEGLLPKPGRTESGYRVYGGQDVARLEFIRKAKRLGLSLEEVMGVLQVHDRKEPTCGHVCDLLDQKLAQVDALVRDLQAFREELAQLRMRADRSADCLPSGSRICGIIENSTLRATRQTIAWLRPAGRRME
ncbi:MAG: heavy metal-responsive transcriptional regulator [Chloroflexi bacterium]|nr:heavy metal-responsive transcriptional regulator [Chloroflexota bacterium]